MLQEIAPHRFDNTYRDVRPDGNSVVLSFSESDVLAAVQDGKAELPTVADLPGAGESAGLTYLFSIDDTTYFLSDAVLPASEGYGYYPVSEVRGWRPKHTVFAILTAYGLHTWYSTRIYCGQCGTKTRQHARERMKECPACGTMEYPKICPAVIVAVWNSDQLLLSRYTGRTYTHYALLAGFAESGETIEQTVHREILEEVGVRVKNLRYYKSQPWGLSSSLLLGFFAELDGPPHITIDETELSEAGWIPRTEIPPVAIKDFSLTNDMIDYFREHPEEFPQNNGTYSVGIP